jgi:hypothetical protein
MTINKLLCGAIMLAGPVSGQVTMSPFMEFGGDGWVAPLELSWLSDTAATERSIAYSAATHHLYVSSRTGGSHIRILNADTGAEVSAETSGLDMTDVAGGIFGISAVCVGGEGTIYACNLVSPAVSEAVPFKIYRWLDEASPPAVAVTTGTITGTRMGDTLDCFGSDTSTLLVAGEGNTGTVGTRNGYAIFSTGDGINFSASLIAFTGTDPAAGDFRAGITFTDGDSVIGSQGIGGFKFTSFNGTTGVLDRTRILTNQLERPMDYILLGGKPLLATLETNGNTTTPADTFSTVRVYDLSDPDIPAMVASSRTATTYRTQGTSGPGTGSVAWGKVTGKSAKLYALSTNNGIQAFTVTVADETPFVITGVNLDAAGAKLTITWSPVAGHTLRVEYSGDLNTWSPAATGLPADTTNYEWTIPAAFTGRAYVRVVQE